MSKLKKGINVCINNYGVIMLIAFFACVHFLASPTYWDDFSFRNTASQQGFSLMDFLIRRYQEWSSRTVIEAVLLIVAGLPVYVWKVLDFFVVLLLYYDLLWLLNYKTNTEKNLLALMLLAFPFSILASTGWMATTMNYLWVLSFGLYTLVGLGRELGLIPQTKHRSVHYFFYLLCMIYSANFEFMGCILVVCFLVALIYCFWNRTSSVFIILGVLLAVISVMYIIFCPGNRLRPAIDVELWTPDYLKMTILDKIRIGFVATYSHFACVPSALFITYALMIFICGMALYIKKETKQKVKIISGVPLGIYMISFMYFVVKFIIPNRMITYFIPSDLIYNLDDALEQCFLLLAFASIIGTSWYILSKLYGMIMTSKLFFVLAMGFGPCFSMGLTAELRSSLLRVMSFAYISLIFVIGYLIKKEQNVWKKNHVFKFLMFASLLCGDLMNALQLIRHIIVYG